LIEFFQSLEHDVQMSLMFFGDNRSYEDVINKSEHKFQVAKCAEDLMLKSLASISKAVSIYIQRIRKDSL